jgi:hypothetical protein
MPAATARKPTNDIKSHRIISVRNLSVTLPWGSQLGLDIVQLIPQQIVEKSLPKKERLGRVILPPMGLPSATQVSLKF